MFINNCWVGESNKNKVNLCKMFKYMVKIIKSEMEGILLVIISLKIELCI